MDQFSFDGLDVNDPSSWRPLLDKIEHEGVAPRFGRKMATLLERLIEACDESDFEVAEMLGEFEDMRQENEILKERVAQLQQCLEDKE